MIRVVWQDDSFWYWVGPSELIGTAWVLIARFGRLEIGVRRAFS